MNETKGQTNWKLQGSSLHETYCHIIKATTSDPQGKVFGTKGLHGHLISAGGEGPHQIWGVYKKVFEKLLGYEGCLWKKFELRRGVYENFMNGWGGSTKNSICGRGVYEKKKHFKNFDLVSPADIKWPVPKSHPIELQSGRLKAESVIRAMVRMRWACVEDPVWWTNVTSVRCSSIAPNS